LIYDTRATGSTATADEKEEDVGRIVVTEFRLRSTVPWRTRADPESEEELAEI
jgi:hypothetical protein